MLATKSYIQNNPNPYYVLLPHVQFTPLIITRNSCPLLRTNLAPSKHTKFYPTSILDDQ
jgi:hypothetical protein